jgi:predicted transcriptional regulator YdeE
MKPLIVRKPEVVLAGMSFYGDPFDTAGFWMEENQIGRLWQRFMRYLAHHEDALPERVASDLFYEVHIYGDETADLGLFEVFVGAPMLRLATPPLELLIKILPGTEYAVFTVAGETIASDWVMEIDRWLAEAGYARSHPFSVQAYDARFKGMDRLTESELDVYMPVRKLDA